MRTPPESSNHARIEYLMTNQNEPLKLHAMDALPLIQAALSSPDPEVGLSALATVAESGCGYDVKVMTRTGGEGEIIAAAEISFKGIVLARSAWARPSGGAG
ncbi:MAG: hypothetical protein CL569_07670 [Alphaproteobacteria bacterium]|nr:hypothetical protein [Alphaproteobacteria bacterium]|tara:strand:- start:1573 stop:1878 length:306 start_codon:yes stop_codon:yes gene_type:complete